jgi:gliding motility-associated-like protein
MNTKKLLLALIAFIGFGINSHAQLVCPPNIDFELGDLSGWTFFTGVFSGGVPDATVPGAPIACRHTLTKAAGLIGCTGPGGVGPLDQYGGFPVLAPGGGSYSLRVGKNENGGFTEKARFYIQIPSGSDNYSLIYRYAVCFQDPGTSHTPAQKPQFIVRVFDSAATAAAGGVVPVLVGDTACSYFKYTAGGTLPGFSTNSVCGTCVPSSASAGSYVQYKGWTTSTVDLSGLAGTTVGIDFISSDCQPTGHFGYGYVDMSCGLFRISASICDTLTPPVLTAPDGFAGYTWYDSATFSVVYGTGVSITIPFPPTPVTIAVVLTPLPGYGCPDTLYTHISPSALSIHPSNDTAICRGRSVMLASNATDIATPIYYSWTPATGLSCATCANPIASPTVTTAYSLTVTNVNGCTAEHVYNVTILPDLITTVTVDTPTCQGFTNGSATVSVTTGVAPYYYTWSTAPVQTTSMASALGADTYTVVVFDAFGCTDTNTAIIKDPDPRIINIDTFFNPTTCLGADGIIVIEGLIAPGVSYTLSYLYGGVPQTRVVVADPFGKLNLNGLTQGVYSNITIIGATCVYNLVGPVTLVDPPVPDLSGVTSNSFVCVDDTLKLFANSTTPGVTFQWDGPGGYSSGLPNPILVPATMAMAGVYSVTVSKANCFNYGSTLVEIRPLPTPVATSNTPVCSNDTLFLYSVSSVGATSYVWYGPNFFNSYDQNPYVAYVQTVSTGVYTVNVTWNGCTVADTMSITINQTPSAPLYNDTNYCQNDIAVPYDVLGTNLVWYTTPTGGVGTSTPPIPSTKNSGIFPMYVTQTSIEGCTSERSKVTARVWLYPKIDLSITDSVSCAGKNITFTVQNVQEGNYGYTWQFESVTDSIKDMNPIYHAFNVPGTYTVAATAYYKYCPTINLKKVINVYPYPSFDLGADTTICPGSSSIQLSAEQLNTYGYTAKWKWGTGETTPKITIVAPGTYRATVTINGCESSDTIKVDKDCYINIPNIFTPNGDGVNDYFFPRQLLSAGLTQFDMNIYNRWGQLVFSANSLEGRGWDGRMNGTPQPEGVYIYTIDAVFKDGQKETHKGNVTLMR